MEETCFLSGLPIGKGQLTKEHVVPKSKVPAHIANSTFNIRPAIKIFNSMKSDLFLCQWEDQKLGLYYQALERWHLKNSDRQSIIKAAELIEHGEQRRNPCKYCLLSIAQEYCFARQELTKYREKWLPLIRQGRLR